MSEQEKPQSTGRRSGGRSARKQARNRPASEKIQAVHPGMPGGSYKPLSDHQVKQVDRAAKRILATIGMGEVPPVVVDKALEQGCFLNDNGRLCFPESFIDDIIAGAGRDFVLHGRNPKYDIELSGTKVHYGTGGAAVQTLDPNSGLYRKSTLVDLYDFARLADQMQHCHWFTRNVVATDVPDNFELDVNTAFACLLGTEKHMGTSFVFGSHVRPIIEMFDAALGGEGEFRKRPFCKVHISPVISPLRYGEDAVDVMQAAIKEGMPINCIIAAQSGATAPAPLAGMLIQTMAETLAGLILVNLFHPGYPVIFSNWPFVVDLRSGAFACGCGEIALLNAGAAQMSNYYNLPGGVAGGLADSKLPDAQAAYEKAVSAVTTGLAGANMVYESSGMYASLLGASFEGFVMDNEILGVALRTVRGFDFNDESMDLDVIEDVVTGAGHFLGHEQTMGAMERDYHYPLLSDRESPEVWMEKGSVDALTRAKQQSRELLSDYYPNFLSKSVQEDARRRFNIKLPEDMIVKSDRWSSN